MVQNQIMNVFNNLWNDEEGQGMVEYGLIMALIAVVVILVLTAIGNNMKTKYEEVNNALN